VELNDIGRRIFGAHYPIIVLLVVIGMAVGLLLVVTSSRTYTASARLVLDNQDTKSRSESTAIADTAKAIATSPAQVRAALERAGVRDRSAVEIAKRHVSISALGTSAVLQLSVSDRNRHVAAAVTNALAERVIRTRLAVSNGQLQQVLVGLQERIDELNTKIAELDAQADSLAVRLADATTAAGASALRGQRDGLLQSRDLLVQQRSVAESERVSLLSADATHPKPSIISRATVPGHADSSHFPSYLALGILLGLILGIGCAGVVELIRPTLVGGDAIARELGVAVLGALPNEPLAVAPRALHTIRARLRLTAEAAQVPDIGVVPLIRGVDLDDIAKLLAQDPLAALSIRQLDVDETPSGVSGRLGLVVVCPSELEKAEVVDFGQFLSLTPQPVLGLITYGRGSANELHRRSARGEKQEEERAA